MTAVANPVAGGRAALGVRFGTTWYFTFHARSLGGQPNDSAQMLTAVNQFVNGRGQGESWIVMGDFNRGPAGLRADLNALPQPPPAAIYSSGLPTQQSGYELDYMVSSQQVGGIMVNRLAGASADHYAVALGALRAAATPSPRFNIDQAIETMQAGGVLDARGGGTSAGTPIISYHRDGAANQQWEPFFNQDNSFVIAGAQSELCIGMSSNYPGDAGTYLTNCNQTSLVTWRVQYEGNNENIIQNVANPSLCLNVRGAPTTPDNAPIIAYNCQDVTNERWLFTPANTISYSLPNPIDLSQNDTLPATMENMTAGADLTITRPFAGRRTP